MDKYNKYLFKNLIGRGFIDNVIKDDIIESIDFDLVQKIIPSNKKIINHYNIYNNIILELKNGSNQLFIFENQINCGSHGCVYLYKSEIDPNIKIVCKYGIRIDDLNDDIFILNLLNKNIICKEYYVSSFIYENNDNINDKIILMEYMDGDLDKLFNNSKPNNEIAISIMQILIEMLECLSKNQLYYTDIKKGNILYKYETNKIKIILGDLGSIAVINTEAIATFPPIFKINKITNNLNIDTNYGIINNVQEYDIVWSLGIVFLSFYLNINPFIHYNIKKLIDKSEEEIKHLIIDKINIFSSYFNVKYKEKIIHILCQMLELDHRKRITMLQLKELFNNLFYDNTLVIL